MIAQNHSPHLQALRDMTDRLADGFEKDKLEGEILEFACDVANVGRWAWYVDRDDVISSRPLARQWGVDKTLVPNPCPADWWTNYIVEEDRARENAQRQVAVDTGAPYEIVYHVRQPSGILVRILARGRLCNIQGRVLVGITVVADEHILCAKPEECRFCTYKFS